MIFLTVSQVRLYPHTGKVGLTAEPGKPATVRSFTHQSFWDAHRQLPAHVQRQARNAYILFQSNPGHPILNFKRVGRRDRVYSVRISGAYRALGIVEHDDIIWFWIGTHQEYDRLLRQA